MKGILGITNGLEKNFRRKKFRMRAWRDAAWGIG
jgi:hypothetical protein